MESTNISEWVQRFQVLALDFDGVILDSVDVKDKAYFEVFSDYGKSLQAQVLTYHKENPGIDRATKMHRIGRNVIGTEFSQAEVEERCRCLSQIIMSQMAACPEKPGLRRFLQWWSKPVYVVTAAPEDEIIQVLKEIGLYDSFWDIKGAPTRKAEHLRDIIRKEEIEPQAMVYIGDKSKDHKAAMEAEASFIGMTDVSDEFDCDQVVGNFNELYRLLAGGN